MDTVSDLKSVATSLHGRLAYARDADPIVVRLTRNSAESNRSRQALLVNPHDSDFPTGYAAYLQLPDCQGEPLAAPIGPTLTFPLPRQLAYLEEGDVVRINPRGAEIWVMYRRASRSNSLLLTERCNSWCVMCSQPPKAREDESLVRAWIDAIPLMDPATESLGFTGGEPTLLGDLFVEMVRSCRDHLPSTALHVLSNGRMFNYLSFAQRLGAVDHPDLVIGIPLYSDISWQHDFIVQAPQAFDQTIRGILNLARCEVPVEIRVVIHRYSVERLPQLAEYVARNLPFVEHVALMGLEPIGFAQANLTALWIDPVDYESELASAVQTLANHGMNVSIYNHQLCTLPQPLWPYARHSISDWKNIYLPACRDCGQRSRCGGLFHSATIVHSRGIKPIEVATCAAAGADTTTSV